MVQLSHAPAREFTQRALLWHEYSTAACPLFLMLKYSYSSDSSPNRAEIRCVSVILLTISQYPAHTPAFLWDHSFLDQAEHQLLSENPQLLLLK